MRRRDQKWLFLEVVKMRLLRVDVKAADWPEVEESMVRIGAQIVRHADGMWETTAYQELDGEPVVLRVQRVAVAPRYWEAATLNPETHKRVRAKTATRLWEAVSWVLTDYQYGEPSKPYRLMPHEEMVLEKRKGRLDKTESQWQRDMLAANSVLKDLDRARVRWHRVGRCR